MRIIIEIFLSIYITSTLFMLYYWLNATISFYRREGKILFMPIPYFLLIHFCPIVNSVRCFKIMKKIVQLRGQRGM